MKLIQPFVTLLLLVGITLAEEKQSYDHDRGEEYQEEQAQVEAYKGILAAAKEIVIYEGLPHPYEEEELLKKEAKRKDIVTLPPLDEAFYTPAVEVVNAEAILKLLAGSDGIQENEPKKCDFHSDFCIQFKHQDTTYHAFFCFGCGEVSVRQGDSGVTFGFNDEELKKLLAVYEKKRPKKVATAPEIGTIVTAKDEPVKKSDITISYEYDGKGKLVLSFQNISMNAAAIGVAGSVVVKDGKLIIQPKELYDSGGAVESLRWYTIQYIIQSVHPGHYSLLHDDSATEGIDRIAKTELDLTTAGKGSKTVTFKDPFAELPEFNYTIYIAKPAKYVWSALTEKKMIDQYYMAPVHVLELKKGGRISYGGDAELISGTIIEIDAPKKLVHTFKFAGSDDPETQVTYEIKPIGDLMCSLTISHTGFPAESQTFADISGGWPVIASSLKTLLETGRSLPWPQK